MIKSGIFVCVEKINGEDLKLQYRSFSQIIRLGYLSFVHP
jgi:hypothetical protein